jgi:hypothetical protein
MSLRAYAGWARFSFFLVCSVLAGKDPEQRFVPGELLVQPARAANPDAVMRALRGHGGSPKHTIGGLNIHVLSLPEPAVDAVARSLARTGLFTFVERNWIGHAAAAPNDPSYPSQWHLPKIAAPAAWDSTVGAVSVTIAILDSGIDPAHTDLASKLLPGWSFLANSANTADVHGHGTSTAGAAAAISDNANGVAGVAWLNPVLPVGIVDSTGSVSYSNMAAGIRYAADQGARVINMSVGGSSPSSALQSAVDYAWSKGAIVVASAMNAGTSTPYYPAACDRAVSVAATDNYDNRASFSNYGPAIDLAAPGVSILTTARGGGYRYASGTSFSAPIVAGVAGLALALRPGLKPAELVNLLTQNADDLGTPGFDPYFGWGRVNASRVAEAVKALAGDAQAPAVAISAPLAGSVLTGTISVQGSATDNVGVAGITLLVDGVAAASTSGSAFSLPWNTLSVPNGSHTLAVEACDASSNCGRASVMVSVDNPPPPPDTQPPTVRITSPLSGATVRKNVTIAVDAADNVGISQVVIYIDGIQQYSGTAAPFRYTWNTNKASSGNHLIEAKAWDNAGNAAAALPVSVRK